MPALRIDCAAWPQCSGGSTPTVIANSKGTIDATDLAMLVAFDMVLVGWFDDDHSLLTSGLAPSTVVP